MKKVLLIGLVFIIIWLAACSTDGESINEGANDIAVSNEEVPYEFEFKDLDGNVHQLSDYAGMPVYLRIWGSWCSVCVSTLGDLNAHAESAEDYVVLTVITPGVAGEMSSEDFAEWFKQYDYDNIVVLVDDKAQIVTDFNIQAYPSQVFFDENGVYITQLMGAIDQAMVEATFEASDRIKS